MSSITIHHDRARERWAWTLLTPVRAYLRWTPLQRGRYWIARYLIFPLFSTGAARVEFGDGVQMHLDYESAVCRQILMLGAFEPAEIREVTSTAVAGTAVIDVGANVGFFTAAVAAHRPDVRVLAIEPLAANLASLEDLVQSSSLSNVAVFATAVGATPGYAHFETPADGAFARVTGDTADESSESTWPVVTLDSVWQDAGRPEVSVVKIDVEGYEGDVLKGAGELLESQSPVLMLEANDAVGWRCELDDGRPVVDGDVHRRCAVDMCSVLMSLRRPGSSPAGTNATHHTTDDGQRIAAGGHLPSL